MPKTTRNTKVNDIRKTIVDPTPLYFAAGVIDKIREVAPERLAAVKATGPKTVQERFVQQAKHTQSRLHAVLSELDTDIRKLREQAQHLALQGAGLAAEYAVKAREEYGELAERGRGAVRTWRGAKAPGAGEGGSAPASAGGDEEFPVFKPEAEAGGKAAGSRNGTGAKATGTAPRKGAAKRATPSRSAAKPTPKTVAKTASKSASAKGTAAGNASGAAGKDEPQA